LQFGYSLFGALLPAGVTEDFHGAYDYAGAVPQRQGAHGHRHTIPILVAQVDIRLPGAPVQHDLSERTPAVTERVPGFIYVAQQIVKAALSDDFLGGVASQLPRTRIPIGNLAVAAHEIDSVVHVVQEFLVERGR